MVKSTKRAVAVYVEGGGNNNAALRAECRQAFQQLLAKAGLAGVLPRVIPCGSRQCAFDKFCHAFADAGQNDVVILLVDAEAPVAAADDPWAHLNDRPGDGWRRPQGATADHCYLMTQCMETWLLADRRALQAYFGDGFREAALPARDNLEDVPKIEVFARLAAATADCKTKSPYGKGAHSFKLLAAVDPHVLRGLASAERFFGYLAVICR